MKKTVIILALLTISTAAQAQSVLKDDLKGSYRVVTNEQDTAAIELLNESNAVTVVKITGLYASNATVFASVGALELGTNGWNAAAALAATALQPSWAITGTVSRAQAAMMLASADSNAWIAVEGGSPWLYSVSSDTSRVYIASSGPGWNGPPVGTALAYSGYSEPASIFAGAWPNTAYLLAEVGGGPVILTAILLDPPGEIQWDGSGNLPATLSGEGPENTCVLDYIPVTNRYQILTEAGTAILISEHNERTDASIHPTLPRHSDVTNTVSAATDTLLSKAEAAATYLPLANIPGPGCTDLGTSNYFDVSGSTIYYRGTMSGISTATVTKAVSEGWTYALTVVGTNTLIISNATLLNTWTPGGTNTYVFTPSTTNAWEVRGMTP